VAELSAELKQQLRDIKLIVLDVDGVLTDGAIILTGKDSDTKQFHVQDGFGVTLARQAGIRFGILTGRILSVSWVFDATDSQGIAVFRLSKDDKKLVGKWAYFGGEGKLFTETLTKIE